MYFTEQFVSEKENKMKKIFEKHETLMCILLIILYVVINSYCMQTWGLTDYRSAIINTILSVALLALVISLQRTTYYGLTKVTNLKRYLYFIPLLFIMSINLRNGIHINNTAGEILFYIIYMVNIGFLEELIFLVFLFKMMAKDNIKSAILVSSITFGIGHIVNLLNGADLVPTLTQICYAIAIGYLFVIIFYKSKSLVPCIIAHSVNNSLSIFNVSNGLSSHIIIAVILVVVCLTYATYISKTIKE
jgi:membrane protease YdiL (CAAX protease family)